MIVFAPTKRPNRLNLSAEGHLARKLKYRRAMKSALIGLIVLATWGSNAAATSAQDARPTFRARTELVTVAATVRTRRGRPVVNLKASDFQLIDKGVPRTITDFKSEPAPV